MLKCGKLLTDRGGNINGRRKDLNIGGNVEACVKLGNDCSASSGCEAVKHLQFVATNIGGRQDHVLLARRREGVCKEFSSRIPIQNYHMFPQTAWLTLGVLTGGVKGRGARSRWRTQGLVSFVVSCWHVYFRGDARPSRAAATAAAVFFMVILVVSGFSTSSMFIFRGMSRLCGWRMAATTGFVCEFPIQNYQILNQTAWLTFGVLMGGVKGWGVRSRWRTQVLVIIVVSCLHVYFRGDLRPSRVAATAAVVFLWFVS